MSLFFKKKKANLKENGFSSSPTNHLIKIIEKGKVKLAGWLGHKTNSYSSFKKKTALIIFCMLFGGLCFYMLSSALHSHGFKTRVLILNHLTPGMSPHRPFISDSAFYRIEKAKHLLDSLKLNDTLKFKAILLSKPALPENLQLLENIYQSQKR